MVSGQASAAARRRGTGGAGSREHVWLPERLDEPAHWSQVLSPGEQQRLSIARALLNKPDWLFLDEATSAIDDDQQDAVYCMLTELLRQTTIVSIGHRDSLGAHHQRLIRFGRLPGHAGQLLETDAAPAASTKTKVKLAFPVAIPGPRQSDAAAVSVSKQAACDQPT